MNYYNPYFYSMPTPKVGIFSKLLGSKSISLGGILNGTQRALNFANQAIPLVKQVKPMIGNAKTMFKVMNEFKRTEKPRKSVNTNTTTNINSNINNKSTVEKENIINENNTFSTEEGPTFFV